MSDIVGRLRQKVTGLHPRLQAERLEAADVIERLRALVAIGECSECGNPLTEKHSLHCRRALEGK